MSKKKPKVTENGKIDPQKFRNQLEESLETTPLDLAFPKEIMLNDGGKPSGPASQYATFLGTCYESPKHFFFMVYLTYLGLLISDITYVTVNHLTRLFIVLLGESARDRKSTAINQTTKFFQGFIASDYGQELINKGILIKFEYCHGAASGEGLGRAFELARRSTPKVMAIYDELKVFATKADVKGSTLLHAPNTLFDATVYENVTTKNAIKVENAHLGFVSASTIDTFSQIFSKQFLDIGFTNRLFLIPGEAEGCIPIPLVLDDDVTNLLYKLLRDTILLADSTRGVMKMDEEGIALWTEYYKELRADDSIFTKRLDVYGLRLMPLIALNDGKTTIDVAVVEKIIKLIKWQHNVRQIYDPIDTLNQMAKLEVKIKRTLQKHGKLTRRQLKNNVNASYYGMKMFSDAVRSLLIEGEIRHDRDNDTYYPLPKSIKM